jgi:hypothetical protein
MDTPNKTVTGRGNALVKIWIGEIPQIFGYGINATGETEAQCRAALKQEYLDQRSHWNCDSSFLEIFEEHGGWIFQIEIGKAYFGGFGNE